MSRNKRFPGKPILFAVIFILLAAMFIGIFSIFPDVNNYQRIAGFYNEPENSLQAVYIGSSNCYAFWNPLVVWHNYGITVYPYSISNMPFVATEFSIREVRKTQPNAKFIVNINSVDADDLNSTAIHYMLAFLPESEEKEQLTQYLSSLIGYDAYQQLEFKYPFIRLRTMPITMAKYILQEGFTRRLNGMKGANDADIYLEDIEDISGDFTVVSEKAELPAYLIEATEKLLDYCDAEHVDVLFVNVPRAEYGDEEIGRINAMTDLLRSRGYTVVEPVDDTAAIGLDLSQDYYNQKHTNIHGSIKFTNHLSEYLIEHFGLEDRHVSGDHPDWDAAWTAYEKVIAPYTTDIEIDSRGRDLTLKAPEAQEAKIEANGVRVSWNAVDGADGYAIYRKEGKKEPWTRIAAFETGTSFTDTTGRNGCTYTVVPARGDGDAMYYGNYRYKGVKARQ